MSKKQPIHYVDNKKFYTEMVKYVSVLNEARNKGVSQEHLPRVPNYIGECIFKIANKLSHSKNFIGYSFREEMISDAIENCLMYIHNFNPDKSKNAFAYFTQISYYAFLRRIQKEQKQQYIKQKLYIENSTMNIMMDSNIEESGKSSSNGLDMDKYKKYSDKFETVSKKNKDKKKKGIEIFMEQENE